MAVIYALVEPHTLEIRYVGQTIQPPNWRLQAHILDAKRGDQRRVARWIRRLGEPPCMIILEEVLDIQLLSHTERAWIACLRRRGCRLTNLTDGGEGTRGFIPGAETRRRMSIARIGHPVTPETRAKISATQRGRTFSPETLARMSAASKRRMQSPEARAQISKKLTGQIISPERRAKISAANKGRPKSPEWKAKASAAQRRRFQDPEERAKIWIGRRRAQSEREGESNAL